MILEFVFVQGEAFEDEAGGLLRRFVVEFDEAGSGVEAGDHRVTEPAEHHLVIVALAQQIVDRGPFQAGPLLHIVVRTDHHDDEVGLFVIKLRQIDAEVAPREFGFVILVVEDFAFAELSRQNSRDLRDIVPLFPRKGEGDAEPFGAYLNRHRPFFGI